VGDWSYSLHGPFDSYACSVGGRVNSKAGLDELGGENLLPLPEIERRLLEPSSGDTDDGGIVVRFYIKDIMPKQLFSSDNDT
jgi:hypothetical protein